MTCPSTSRSTLRGRLNTTRDSSTFHETGGGRGRAVFGRGVVGPYFEFQDLRFFLLAFACPRVPRAHHLARRATLLLSITNRPPPPLSFSCFTLGDLRLRPGIVPTLTLTFNKTSARPPFFRARVLLVYACLAWLDLRNGPRTSPTRRLALPFERAHPHSSRPTAIRATHPLLARTCARQLPSSRPHPPASFYFSLRYI